MRSPKVLLLLGLAAVVVLVLISPDAEAARELAETSSATEIGMNSVKHDGRYEPSACSSKCCPRGPRCINNCCRCCSSAKEAAQMAVEVKPRN